MKAQGVKLGSAPYGYEHAKHVNEKGRRVVVPLSCEQAVIDRVAALHGEGVKFEEIARRLNADHVPARQGGDWCGRVLSVILQREGKYIVRPHKEYAPRVPLVHDKAAAAARARELKSQELSLRAIGGRLRKEGLVPARGGKWHAASVLDLLRYRDPRDRAGTAQRAKELRAQGLSLREVGARLSSEGHVHELGGGWYAARVSALLDVERPSAQHPSVTIERVHAEVPTALA